MKNPLFLIVSVIAFSFISCGKLGNSKKLNSNTSENVACNSIQECLDKKDFEKARTFCAEEKESCDKKSILEIETQFWIDQDEYKRAQQIALEIFSYNSLDKIEQNNWYAEKLNDIVSRAIIQNKIEDANKIVNDFPLEIKGDRTLKFKIDALKTIIELYPKNSKNEELKSLTLKLKEAEKKLLEFKREWEKEKKEEISKLKIEIAKLQKEKLKKSKELRKELIELKKEKRKAEERLEEIQKEFYIFSSRREKDIDSQQNILNEINGSIQKVEFDIENIYDNEIEEKENRIKELKNESY